MIKLSWFWTMKGFWIVSLLWGILSYRFTLKQNNSVFAKFHHNKLISQSNSLEISVFSKHKKICIKNIAKVFNVVSLTCQYATTYTYIYTFHVFKKYLNYSVLLRIYKTVWFMLLVVILLNLQLSTCNFHHQLIN